jgi:hypothetical protein
MSDPVLDMLDGYDDVEASSGMSGDPLPTGWYLLTVEKLLDMAASKAGVPMARLQLNVDEGEHAKQKAFVSIALGPKATNKDGSNRSPEEFDKAKKSVQAQAKGLLKAIAVETAQPLGEGLEKVFSFYNVQAWEGRQFVGKIQLRIDRSGQYDPQNALQAYHHIDDAKKGVAWLRSRSGGPSVAAGAATI